MASFSFQEYPHQTMAPSSADDFTLFPAYDWPQDQSFMPTTTFQDPTYLQASSFDYTQQYSFDLVHYPPKPQQPLSPRQSPAQSATHLFEQQPKFLSSISDSGASAPSTISSTMASPSVPSQNNGDWSQRIYCPGIQSDETFATPGLDFERIPVVDTKGCVDPSLIQPFSPHFPDLQAGQSPHFYAPIPSPAPSGRSGRSPNVQAQHWQTYSTSRRQSVSSVHSRHSQTSISSDDSNKGLCPIPSCGRHFKDLKAHMLTHQETRPEKCPIPTCEYHIKGFARKYDKNRHTLTHYKGTMVCGFCPGSGSAAEKSFNRADVFKRHLTSVHNVEQTPPNARRKSPPSTANRSYGIRESGMCSTCNNVFANPQDFYEHLDDCVLRVVQQADPSEAVNQKLLSAMTDDNDVQETMQRHMLSNEADGPTSFDDDEEEDDVEDDEDGQYRKKGSRGRKNAANGRWQLTNSRAASHVRAGGNYLTGGGAVCKSRKGMTYSKEGVPLALASKGNKRRKHYPISWGTGPEKMRMKKRVLCVFDGDRRLWKDDMMLDAQHEVRIPLQGGDGRAYVSDLDVCTLQRAEGLHNATEEEKGPRLSDEEVEQLMA